MSIPEDRKYIHAVGKCICWQRAPIIPDTYWVSECNKCNGTSVVHTLPIVITLQHVQKQINDVIMFWEGHRAMNHLEIQISKQLNHSIGQFCIGWHCGELIEYPKGSPAKAKLWKKCGQKVVDYFMQMSVGHLKRQLSHASIYGHGKKNYGPNVSQIFPEITCVCYTSSTCVRDRSVTTPK